MKKVMKLLYSNEVNYFVNKMNHTINQWVLTGSYSLYLRGLKIIPSDIDILTTRDGVKYISGEFKNHIIQPFTESKLNNIKSHYGVLRINEATFDIMGDPENNINGIWKEHIEWKDNIIIYKFENKRIPVLSLEYELKLNSLICNDRTTKILKKYLTA